MIGRFCPIVYSYLVTNAMEDNILNKCDITVHMLELSSLRNYEVKTKNGGRFYTSEKNSYDYWKTKYEEVRAEKKLLQEKRMIVYFRKDLTDFQKLDLITGIDKQISALTDEVLKMSIILMKNMMNFPSKENYTMRLKRSIEGKSLIFANTQLQADRICEHSYHGANKNSVENLELLRSGKINQMSCVLQLNEGITIPGLKEAIIMHAYGNERKTAQRLSRTLNLNPDEISRVHILCYRDTVDEKWVQSALKDFNPDRITYYYEKENIYVPELLNTVEED